MYTRRDFGKIALASVPVSAVLAAKINSKIAGVQLGAQSYSFRDVPLDDAIAGMAADSCGVCELYSGHIEPPSLSKTAPIPAPGPGGRPTPRTFAFADSLREWRKTVPLSYFHEVKKKFDDAGITMRSIAASILPTPSA
jgi:hypothetical protein